MNLKIKLYSYWRSSASWRVRWALNLKGVKYEQIAVNLLKAEHKSPEHFRLHPLGAVPILSVQDERGQTRNLIESLPIIEWIDEVFSHQGVLLMGADPYQRQMIRAACEFINADTAPLQTPRAQKRHSSDVQEQGKWAQDFIREGLQAFDTFVLATQSQFCFGDKVTAADIFLTPQIYNAKRWGVDTENEFPKLEAIYHHCLESDACFLASPELQPDAPKDTNH